MTEKEKTVGIIGGMGPDATVDIFKRILRLTPANDDADHIHCLIDNDPKIPSRIKALIEGTGENPGPYLAEMARKLETWGADFIIIPCNTAHYYYNYIANAVSVPVVHLIDLLAEKIRINFPEYTRVGVTASTAVLITGLYAKELSRQGFQPVYPEKSDQEKLLKIIKGVKAGNTDLEAQENFKKICQKMFDRGMKVIIVACTELSVIAEKLSANIKPGQELPYHLIDAAELLAAETIAIVKYGKNPHLPKNPGEQSTDQRKKLFGN